MFIITFFIHLVVIQEIKKEQLKIFPQHTKTKNRKYGKIKQPCQYNIKIFL